MESGSLLAIKLTHLGGINFKTTLANKTEDPTRMQLAHSNLLIWVVEVIQLSLVPRIY